MFCYLTAGLRIEEGTAKFYLDVAEGNLKDAIALYGELLHLTIQDAMLGARSMHCCKCDTQPKAKPKVQAC